MTEFSLQDKVAVITGGSRGIGRAIALCFAEAGASVVVSSRTLGNVEAVAEEIRAAGGRALAVEAHVGEPPAIERLVARTIETFGQIDIVVNNAATNPHFGPVLTADEGQWDKILDTNTKGVFRVCKAVVPHMESRGGGKIINLASIAGHANIQVNAIAPGIIKTRFSRVLWQTPHIAEPVLKALPLGRFGEPTDVAGLALYLASPASDYVTGAVFLVDGGMSVSTPMA
jgi:NAD(P)-dependent dehydrogenase (short-subunit alcohol dehydrogenase family)